MQKGQELDNYRLKIKRLLDEKWKASVDDNFQPFTEMIASRSVMPELNGPEGGGYISEEDFKHAAPEFEGNETDLIDLIAAAMIDQRITDSYEQYNHWFPGKRITREEFCGKIDTEKLYIQALMYIDLKKVCDFAFRLRRDFQENKNVQYALSQAGQLIQDADDE